MKEKNKFRDSEIQQPDNSRLAKEIRRRQAQKDRFMTKMDRLFGFILLSALILGCAGLGLLYILEKGPSESLRDSFVMTMQETRRFDFISNIFLEQETINEIKSAADDSAKYVPVAKTMQNIETASLSAHEVHVELAQDDDGDGIIFEEIKGGGYLGYMITVLDPTRIIIGTPDSFGGVGWTMEDLVKKYDAIGGVNGGGFKDEGGTGSGGLPVGLTIIDGKFYGDTNGESAFVGFDANGKMYFGYFNQWLAEYFGIVNGVSFGPMLIVDGEPAPKGSLGSGVNPRTAIAQRSDGAVMMLCIDGRQVHSMGATYQDCIDIFLARGAVNAINMDGGSSTTMYYNGEYINSPSGTSTSRLFPSVFLFK
ncbi:MAG: phosphodiester glycosidase family protein [Eubacteriales bacterium]|nr:phosphodiester glycosidase family protein [Eubacteriales bacterium]